MSTQHHPIPQATCFLDLLLLSFGNGFQNCSLDNLTQQARDVWVLGLLSLELHTGQSVFSLQQQQQQKKEERALIDLV